MPVEFLLWVIGVLLVVLVILLIQLSIARIFISGMKEGMRNSRLL